MDQNEKINRMKKIMFILLILSRMVEQLDQF